MQNPEYDKHVRGLGANFISLEDLEECASMFEEMMYYSRVLEEQYRKYGEQEPDYPSPNAWAIRGVFCTNGEALCESLGGHDIVDRSSAGPDSGDIDCECVRCGRYFHHRLY